LVGTSRADASVAVAGPEPGGWRFPLSPTSDPEVFTADLDSPQAGDQVRFHRTADGRVFAISWFHATFARLDPVVADRAERSSGAVGICEVSSRMRGTCSLIPAAIGDPREGHEHRGHGTR
jgi:hypothetical protein